MNNEPAASYFLGMVKEYKHKLCYSHIEVRSPGRLENEVDVIVYIPGNVWKTEAVEEVIKVIYDSERFKDLEKCTGLEFFIIPTVVSSPIPDKPVEPIIKNVKADGLAKCPKCGSTFVEHKMVHTTDNDPCYKLTAECSNCTFEWALKFYDTPMVSLKLEGEEYYLEKKVND